MELTCTDTSVQSVKRRRTRRGRKKRCKCMTSFEDQPCESCSRFNKQNDAKLKGRIVEGGGSKVSRSRRHGLRPTSPKAPRNTTDFLIEDHLSSRQSSFAQWNMDIKDEKQWSPALDVGAYDQIYVLCSTDEQCVPGMDLSVGGETPAIKPSPAFSDIDYQYESHDSCEDTFSFLQQDFETAYTNVLEESLLSLPKEELVSKIMSMQERLVETENLFPDTNVVLPSSVKTESAGSNLKDLMCELNSLKDQNRVLIDENLRLKSGFP